MNLDSLSSQPRKWLGVLAGSNTYLVLCQLLLGLGILLLPITSFPILVQVSGASTVAPPSNLLFVLLLGVWAVPFVIRGGRLPVEVFFFSLFILVVVFTWAAAFFIELPPFRDGTILSQGRSALITLVMGVAAFLIPAGLLSLDRRWISSALLFINVSGLLLVLWSLAQAYIVFFHDGIYPDFFYKTQQFFSSRGNPLFNARLTGFAYEPSWLAHQLVILYLPFWLAASLSGFTTLSRRLWRFSLENILLVSGFLVLFLSFSRIGFLSFMLILGFVALQVSIKIGRKFHQWIFNRWKVQAGMQWLTKALVSLALFGLFLFGYLGAILGAAYLGSFVEPRLERLFSARFEVGSVYEIANQLAFAERAVYWAVGWEVFNDYPMFGVGLGNVGFFFQEKMPTFGHALWEVSQLFNYETHIPNSKNMWVRILAETGLVGFAFFLTWYYFLWRSARLSLSAPDPTLKVVGIAGQFVLVGFLLEGFSIDSFALPYFWFSAGLVVAAGAVSRRMFVVPKVQEGK
jgi:hypothetical protein